MGAVLHGKKDGKGRAGIELGVNLDFTLMVHDDIVSNVKTKAIAGNIARFFVMNAAEAAE